MEKVEQVFNTISLLRNIQRDYLLIDHKVNWYFIKVFFKYNIWKKYTFKEWKNGLIMYSINNMYSWKESVNSLLEEKIIGK